MYKRQGKYGILLELNPVSAVIIAYRDILYFGRVPDIKQLSYSFISGMLFLFIGECVFRKLQRRFAEEL